MTHRRSDSQIRTALPQNLIFWKFHQKLQESVDTEDQNACGNLCSCRPTAFMACRIVWFQICNTHKLFSRPDRHPLDLVYGLQCGYAARLAYWQLEVFLILTMRFSVPAIDDFLQVVTKPWLFQPFAYYDQLRVSAELHKRLVVYLS